MFKKYERFVNLLNLVRFFGRDLPLAKKSLGSVGMNVKGITSMAIWFSTYMETSFVFFLKASGGNVVIPLFFFITLGDQIELKRDLRDIAARC